ncbi:hypothetical protein L198_02272 [Cryptococcus wingfieldii CBS 7118]|uniref:Uncharacterized protein n=1 Tax=Cryptococcus wingfieldii CBS 7118 TaxID=1295528 RepID=A0A1E3JRF5_9TREE|nr:hypothetical protein L198_02272 [Cryptococcus wingfieldii CBS 7118]ODO03425.1 hypothetical protein L198_02272 [Cryptococcus wingfieldii CBS 7118]
MSIPPQPTLFLSPANANALISDHRPTTLSSPALTSLNSLLDEVLVHLISAAQSINPLDLRKEAIPSLFHAEKGAGDSTAIQSLGRSAVSEAEVELRSWMEDRGPTRGFPPGGKGSGTRSERAFPVLQAVELMRIKCVTFSTLAPPEAADASKEEQAIDEWKTVGGDATDDTVEPAALWLTAVIEHICEHILAQLARVVARDSGSSVASPQDLYTALCEDESIWGVFKRMKAKEQIEFTIRASTRSKRSNTSRSSPDNRSIGRASPALSSASPGRDVSIDTTRSVRMTSPGSATETNAMGGISGGLIRKGSTLNRRGHTGSPVSKVLHYGQHHERNGSVLSINTRSMLSQFQDSFEDDQTAEDIQEAQQEFDKLVKSGDTMKLANGKGKRPQTSPSPGTPSTPPVPPLAHIDKSRRSHSINRVPPPIDPSPLPTDQLPATRPFDASSPPRPPLSSKRSQSDKRLVARTAKVIDEEEEEEEDPAGVPDFLKSKSKKESLMDILAGDPLPESSHPPAKRTVPAVVLGTPPPAAPESKRKAAPSPIVVAPHVQRPGRVKEVTQVVPEKAVEKAQPPKPAEPAGRPRRKTDAQELADFFNLGPPSGTSSAAPTLRTVSSFQRNGGKKRTEAQDLADFFNFEPPPAAPSPTSGEQPPLTAKSNRFRGFMSKVTGSGKKRDAAEAERHFRQGSTAKPAAHGPLASLSLSRLNSETPSAPPAVSSSTLPPHEMRRQKSLGNMDSAPSSYKDDAPALPAAHTQTQTGVPRIPTPPKVESIPIPEPIDVPQPVVAPSPPQKDSARGKKALRKPSLSNLRKINPNQSSAGTPISGQSDAPPSAVSAGASSHVTVDQVAAATAALAGLGLGVDDERRGEDPEVPVSSVTTSVTSTPNGREKTSRGKSRSRAGTVSQTRPIIIQKTTSTTAITTAASPSDPASNVGTSREPKMSTGASIDKAASTSPVNEKVDEAAEPVAAKDASPDLVLSVKVPTIKEPSIPLTDLLPLRLLLAHATSATECRLLLNAILTQFGVPQAAPASANQDASDEGAEERVMAWLLAGREGPVGDYGYRQPLPASSCVSEQGGGEEKEGHEKAESCESTKEDRIVTPVLGSEEFSYGRKIESGQKGFDEEDVEYLDAEDNHRVEIIV